MELYIYLLIIIVLVYIGFQRKCNNLIYKIAKKRDYVVIYFRKDANRQPLKYNLVPNRITKFVKIQGGMYDCSKEHALPMIPDFQGRLHFLIHEGNSIPIHSQISQLSDQDVIIKIGNKIIVSNYAIKENANEYICPKCHETIIVNHGVYRYWANRVKAALTTQAYEFIYGEKKAWALIIAIIALVIAIGVGVYEFSEIQKISPLVETIYQRTVVGNETLVIKPS